MLRAPISLPSSGGMEDASPSPHNRGAYKEVNVWCLQLEGTVDWTSLEDLNGLAGGLDGRVGERAE